MGGKGKDGKGAGTAAWLTGKPYKKALEEVTKNTQVRVADFDQKATQLLDFFQQREKAEAALDFLRQAADGVVREDIVNWRAYIYTLLRKSDEALYNEMKMSVGGAASSRKKAEKPEREKPAGAHETELNAAAAEFVPGMSWGGSLVGTTPTVHQMQPPHYAYSPGYFPGYAQMAPPPPPLSAPCPGYFAYPPPPPAGPPAPSGHPPGGVPLTGIPSIGSAGHASKNCKPCAFHHTKGCSSGVTCRFCHLCGSDEKKTRKKDKDPGEKEDDEGKGKGKRGGKGTKGK